MSVYTRVDDDDLKTLLLDYAIGELKHYQGITAGITNTNYFVSTTDGDWILTLFEQTDSDALPFFMQLMDHLAAHGTPCAHPVARNDGNFLSRICGRPAALVYRLPGVSVDCPQPRHCAALGEIVAQMHHAVRSLAKGHANPRDLGWIMGARERLAAVSDAERLALLDDEIAFQTEATHRYYTCLPQAVIHADIFRDNVLFENARVRGVIDFYYACRDYLLFDLAVICNDWAFDADQCYHADRWSAFIHAYERRRALTDAEHNAWGAMLRAAALRFWVSRLVDYHFPLDGDVTHVHDPAPFEHLLRRHRQDAPALVAE